MRPTYLRWFVISSIAFALTAQAATRPRYGGTLRVETRAWVSSLDPIQHLAPSDAQVRDSLVPLLFDTLVGVNANGVPQPRLALRWQSENVGKRWQFWLRPGVVMQDGSTLTPAVVAQSLSSSLVGFTVRAATDSVILESSSPVPGLLGELALPRNAIVVRDGGTAIGCGAFRLAEFQPNRRVLMRANDDYWNGRPYLDMIDVALGQSLRDQAMHFQLGRADVIEVGLDQVRRATQDNRRIVTSSPSELLAIVVPHGMGAAEDPRMREALSLAIDRTTIDNVLLQRQGNPAGALLPQWMSGYAFLFPTATDVSRARQLRAELGNNQPAIQLGYDLSDTTARMVAERIAVNARDAGILVQAVSQLTTTTQTNPRIVRIGLNSPVPEAALADAVAGMDSAQVLRVLSAKSTEELYQTERALLEDYRVIPIAHVPHSFALSPKVRNWSMRREGGLPLDNVWLESGQ